VTFTLLLVLRRERGQGSVLRHQEHLVAVAKRIAADRGAPGGPTALLACLTGVAAPAQPPNPEIVQELQRAAKDQPDDPQAPQMLAAFVEDPARTATGFLAEGRGYEALGELDRAIATAEAARLAGDLAIELQLHRLYLARGVANLTAAVGRATEARTDLALASYLRPGPCSRRRCWTCSTSCRRAISRSRWAACSATGPRLHRIGCGCWERCCGRRPGCGRRRRPT
jgi:hypothetical protein